MSKSETLRALVTERLTAAAEEIFVLFERTIAEYEEELCPRKENQRNPRGPQPAGGEPELALKGVQTPLLGPALGLNQEFLEIRQIKEEPAEQSVKQEKEQLPEHVQESSVVCVVRGESSLLQQRMEHKEETQEEDISSDPYFHSETEEHTEYFPYTDNDNDWEPFSSAAAQTDTEAYGDPCSQVQTRASCVSLKYTPETSASVVNGDMLGAEWKEVECPFCQRRYISKLELQMHIRLHTDDKPFTCSICEKKFADKSNLRSHIRTHSDEKPFSCSICEKAFTRNSTLRLHMRIHTGEKPYRCSACNKTFTRKDHLLSHKRTHKDGDFSFEETLQLFNP